MGIGLWVGVVALVAATGLGLLLRRGNGRMRPVTAGATGVLDGLGIRPGVPATLVQFSSEFCAPCRATRAVCADLATELPGVEHLELDAAEHMAAVRELDIRRTPTVLVVDAAGAIIRRASGQLTRPQVLAAVSDLL